MVSKAREDLPEPLTPVTTVMALCGISTLMFLRLWTRAPRMERVSCAVFTGMSSLVATRKLRQRGLGRTAQTSNYKAGCGTEQTALWIGKSEEIRTLAAFASGFLDKNERLVLLTALR